MFHAHDPRQRVPRTRPLSGYQRFRASVKLLAAAMSMLLVATATAEPIGFMERFALAKDREAVLAELIPGSEDHFYYHCLHYQTTGRIDLAQDVINRWAATPQFRNSARLRAMTERQHLLTFDRAPQPSIDYFQRQLGVRTNHPSPVQKGQRRYPSVLPKDVINPEQWVRNGLRSNQQLSPLGMQLAADLFLKSKGKNVEISLKDFLKRVNGPYLQGLDQLVILEMQARNQRDRRFGDLAAHRHLTKSELQRVGQAVKDVTDDDQYVNAVLQTLRPSADIDLSQQPGKRLAYLQQVRDYVKTLPAAYNSMKAASYYRLLEANLSEAIWDEVLFIDYLKLPRQSGLVREEVRRQSSPANLNADYSKVAILPPIGNETQLVETYLEHFLVDAPNMERYQPYLQDSFLRRVFARTKLMAGVGNQQPYFDMLSAAERRALRDRILLTFAATNPIRYNADERTQLQVDVKNIDKLVVRVYEMNPLAFYRANQGRLDSDVDLDGLIATHERTIEYDRPSIVRHRETIEIPEAKGRGVWVVDLVGEGRRARTIIRRGDLQTVQSEAANGVEITVVDEARQPLKDAKIYVGAQEFTADENGRILLPMVNQSVQRNAIVSAGKVAKRVNFRQPAENYRLDAGFFVDESLLQSGRLATLLVRPRLLLNDIAIDPAIVKKATVKIVAVDLDGIETTKQFDGLELDQVSEISLPFRVPSRVSDLKFSLSGLVVGLSDRRQRPVAAQQSVRIAGIRKSVLTLDTMLSRNGDDYIVETRGRNGEAVPAATVAIRMETDISNNSLSQTLQSDDAGRVNLGPLKNIRRLRYGIAGQGQHTIDLALNEQVWPGSVNLAAGQSLRLPLIDGKTEKQFRLLETTRGNGARFDRSELLKFENGFLTASELKAGDYYLVDRENGRQTPINVVEGEVRNQVVVGQVRHRQQSVQVPITIADIKQNDDGSLKIQLTGDSKASRVHLIASRYLTGSSPIAALSLGMPSLRGRQLSLERCGYVSDLRLGDEYEYVLRRQYAAKYPGVMLPQPGVLLNPWETEVTSNSSQSAKSGDRPMASSAPQAAADFAAPNAARGGMRASADGSDFDYLSDPGLIVANLTADDKGLITVDAELIGGMPIIQVVLTDPTTVMRRTITAKNAKVETEDLRLPQALAADKNYTFEREVTVVTPDKPLDLATLGSAQVQVYADVASMLKLYQTLINDARLGDFEIVGRWHNLSREEKLTQYSKLASHELHLFIRMHDLDFFNEVVEPYLRNKKEKQLIDHWLLGDDLSGSTELWRYRKLSAAEQALLALRLPALRSSIRRDLAEKVDILKPDHTLDRRRIESALRANRMLGEDLEVEEEALAEMADGISRFARGARPEMLRKSASNGSEAAAFGLAMPGSRPAQSNSLRRRQLGREMTADKAKKSESRMDRLEAAQQLAQGGMGGGFGGRAMGMMGGGAFYQPLDATKQWAESHFDRVRVVGGTTPASLIPVNRFWRDLANNEVKGNDWSPAVSKYLLDSTENRHSALIALAMSGLPLEAGKVALPAHPETMYRPEHAVALITKRLRQLEAADEESSILIGQLFSQVGVTNPDDGGSVELNRFVTGQAYQGKVVVSNPTAVKQTIELFWQIPAGSIALSGGQTTDSKTVTLEPFQVSSIQYTFYFPQAGEFAQYPATVSSEDQLLAMASSKTFKVADQWEDDTVTWQSIARSGSAQDIDEFLKTANLNQIQWPAVYHRLRDADVYKVITKVVGDARLPLADVWAYGFYHKDADAIGRFLSLRNDVIGRVGPQLESTLLTVDAIDQATYEHLEYAPLVRARIHRLGDENEILNPKFMAQYRSFVTRLGYQSKISEESKLALTYYLLLQNRIEEAINWFAEIDPKELTTDLQYNYMAGYLALHEGRYEDALEIAQPYLKHPVPRWAGRFNEMRLHVLQRSQLMDSGQLVAADAGKDNENGISNEAADLAMADRDRANSAAAADVPEAMVKVEDDQVRIDYRNTDQVEINLYGVDLELLFSKAPFARNDLQRIAMVRPTQSDTIGMPQTTGTARYAIPENLRSKTLLVESHVGASRNTTLYYGGQLTTYVSEGFGQLQTTDATTHQPVAKAYVKVYARYPDGRVKFYKDGYTDGRGRFDYVSVSAADAAGAQRYAILVLSEDKGATLHDVAAPN